MFVKQKLLTLNTFSRPGRSADMKPIKGIILHWTASPKGTPLGVYNWFEQRKNGKHSYGSAHFCVGIDGEVWQYIPQQEMAYHVGSKTYTQEALNKYGSYPNNATIGVEMCHLTWEGEYSQETWQETKMLTALLLMEYGLNISDIDTHKGIVGWKECPQWFHRFPEELDRFKQEVGEIMKSGIKGIVSAMWGLNVRDDVMGNKVGFLKNGEEVEITGIKDGWYRVKTKTLEGYASGKHIDT